MKTIVYNVNDDTLDGNDTIVPWRHAPLTVLRRWPKPCMTFRDRSRYDDDHSCLYWHPVTVDGPRGKDLRASRAAAENIIPTLRGRQKPLVW